VISCDLTRFEEKVYFFVSKSINCLFMYAIQEMIVDMVWYDLTKFVETIPNNWNEQIIIHLFIYKSQIAWLYLIYEVVFRF